MKFWKIIFLSFYQKKGNERRSGLLCSDRIWTPKSQPWLYLCLEKHSGTRGSPPFDSEQARACLPPPQGGCPLSPSSDWNATAPGLERDQIGEQSENLFPSRPPKSPRGPNSLSKKEVSEHKTTIIAPAMAHDAVSPLIPSPAPNLGCN